MDSIHTSVTCDNLLISMQKAHEAIFADFDASKRPDMDKLVYIRVQTVAPDHLFVERSDDDDESNPCVMEMFFDKKEKHDLNDIKKVLMKEKFCQMCIHDIQLEIVSTSPYAMIVNIVKIFPNESADQHSH